MTGPAAAPPAPTPPASPPARTAPRPPAASAPTPEPPPTDQAPFIPDDVALGFEDLPPDFWDAPAHEAKAALLNADASANRAARPAAPEPTPEGEPEAAATPVEEAFNQLQGLFPGRVIEVRPLAAEPAAGMAELDASGDDLAAADGYDDEDQDGLQFGPRDA